MSEIKIIKCVKCGEEFVGFNNDKLCQRCWDFTNNWFGTTILKKIYKAMEKHNISFGYALEFMKREIDNLKEEIEEDLENERLCCGNSPDQNN